MKKIVYILFILFVVRLTAQDYENKTFSLLDENYRSGKISYSQMMLNKFYYVFDDTKLDKKFYLNEHNPIKCLTTLINSYYKNIDKFTAEEKVIIENYIDPFKEKQNPLAVYNSPGGKFQLTYVTSGSGAVPATDSNGNGVPDFVEWIANYFDYSWAFEVDTLGLLAPPIGTGRYQIGFASMQAYGYTTIVSGALTRIVMHNTFIGFPPNTDPEGGQKGAAKVTAAHEFKHATQINYNYWNEPDWFIEIDATWMEDIAYDNVNDYYNYLSSTGSPFTSPGQSLDAGDGYEDCVWMHYLTERNDVLLNKRLWQRRSGSSEYIFDTFNFILSNFYSSNFSNAFKEFGIWNMATGSRTTLGFGYGEAMYYPTSVLCSTITTFPNTKTNCAITSYSNNFFRINSPNDNKSLVLNFNGLDGNLCFRVGLLIKKTDGSVSTSEIVLNGNNDGNYIIPTPNNQLSYVGLSVSIINGFLSPTFSFTVSEQDLNSVNISVNQGWNLLSVPVNAANMDFNSLFPEKASDVYVFNGAYQTATTAQVSKGFWIKYNTPTVKTITGTVQQTMTFPVYQGWNIIGPLNFDMPVAAITTVPTGIVSSSYYEFSNGYNQVTTLNAGKGYWVKVSSDGQMTIQAP